jgi:hypothetical protein
MVSRAEGVAAIAHFIGTQQLKALLYTNLSQSIRPLSLLPPPHTPNPKSSVLRRTVCFPPLNGTQDPAVEAQLKALRMKWEPVAQGLVSPEAAGSTVATDIAPPQAPSGLLGDVYAASLRVH